MSEIGEQSKHGVEEVIWYNRGESICPDQMPYVSLEDDQLDNMPKIGRVVRSLIGLLEAPEVVQTVLHQQAEMIYSDDAVDGIPIPRIGWHTQQPVTLGETVSRRRFFELLKIADRFPSEQ